MAVGAAVVAAAVTPGGDGGFGGAGIAAMHGGGAGPMVMHGESVGPMMRGGPMTTAPMVGGRSWNGRTFSRNNFAWGAHDHFHDHFHHSRHRNKFFAFGFAGPIYDYAYGSCWTRVPTYHGWQWVYVCGDYPY
jgi:hypothetical protein